jgi:hypothetical protein
VQYERSRRLQRPQCKNPERSFLNRIRPVVDSDQG